MTTPSILKEMGARLKEYRLRKGLMQSELAESAGVRWNAEAPCPYKSC